MKLDPLSDGVLVKRHEAVATTKGGIVLPDAAKEAPKRGLVVAVGPGVVGRDGVMRPCAVKAGENVVFGAYSGTNVDLDGEMFVLMRENEVLGVLRD